MESESKKRSISDTALMIIGGVVLVVALIVVGLLAFSQPVEDGDQDDEDGTIEMIEEADKITEENCVDGKWIDTHLHIETDAAFENVQTRMDDNNISCSLAFIYVNPMDPRDGLEILKEDYVGDLNRLIPFFFVTPQKPSDGNVGNIEKVRAVDTGFFHGHGELAFYRDPFKESSLLEDNWQKIFEYSESEQFYIMFHLRSVEQVDELEQVLQTYPEAKMLLHGPELLTELPRLLSTYENLYYTLDTATLLIERDEFDVPTNILMYADQGSYILVDALANDRQALLQKAYDLWGPVIAAAPDRVMWGTDASADWHFDSDIYADLVSFSEEFLAMLPENQRDGYMYANAKREFLGN